MRPWSRRFLESVSPEDIRARFHGAMRDFSGALLIRLTQIDYDREMALIGFRDGDELPLGVVRLYAEPDKSAESSPSSCAATCTAMGWAPR